RGGRLDFHLSDRSLLDVWQAHNTTKGTDPAKSIHRSYPGLPRPDCLKEFAQKVGLEMPPRDSFSLEHHIGPTKFASEERLEIVEGCLVVRAAPRECANDRCAVCATTGPAAPLEVVRQPRRHVRHQYAAQSADVDPDLHRGGCAQYVPDA